MPALAALTNQDTFEAPQTAACLPLKLCLWTEVISCYSQGKKRSLLPPPLYPHRLSFISFPARESQRHSNQNLCKLTPNVTQYYKGRKMLIFFFFLPWSLDVGCTHSYYSSDFVASRIPAAWGFVLKIPKHRELCWHCHQQLKAERRVRSKSAGPLGSAPANSKCRKKCRDLAEMETTVKARRFT